MMDHIINYIDFIWLPIGLYIVHKEQRIVAAAFFISCFIMMRLQIEMLHSMGYPTGILPLLKFPVETTAMVVYMVFYVAYLALAYWSPRTNRHIFLAASISIFFAAMIAAQVIMLL
ncbi:MAG: hypothetical protein GW778_06960 [Alphaproteobacteria bacterium]|nr:hypothetical protein [Alphaproteobacteria bacterium]